VSSTAALRVGSIRPAPCVRATTPRNPSFTVRALRRPTSPSVRYEPSAGEVALPVVAGVVSPITPAGSSARLRHDGVGSASGLVPATRSRAWW